MSRHSSYPLMRTDESLTIGRSSAFGGVGHAMRLQIVPNKLTNDLRGRQILRRAQLLKRFFLDGINEHS